MANTENGVRSDYNEKKRELISKEEQIDALQRSRMREAPERIDELIERLNRIRDTFYEASKMSNVGAKQFDAVLGMVITDLKDVSRLLGDIRLKTK